ncbi:MAG: hypothetical protein VZR09_03735 [Candidatus Gastranaerophilaceae bacterium]|nr:hypothetical protein [Candidatus Gastranaerophilaceae bacterium]
MKKFNLSKYHTLNYLAWFSIISNLLFILFLVLEILKIKNSITIFEIAYSVLNVAIYQTINLFVICIMIISTFIELILRKYNKITTYNALELKKLFRYILLCLALFLIVIDIFILNFAIKFYQFIYLKLGL